MTVHKSFWWWLLLFCFLGLPALAVPWPKVESALDQWQGKRLLTLRSDLADPLSSPQVQRLLEFLLDGGFAVVNAPLGTRVEEGLVLDLRTAETGVVLVLSRAPEGVILAFDRLTRDVGAEGAAAKALPADLLRERPPGTDALLPGPLDLTGSPRRLAVLGTPAGPELLLLSDRSLDRYRFAGVGLEKLDSHSPPISPAKALHLDAGDLDGDGREEIAAVWAEEIGAIYGGIDARIHSWIFPTAGALEPASPDLEGYLRLLPEGGFWQGRGAHRPFAGPVLPLARKNQEICVDEEVVAWGRRSLYQATPLGAEEMVAWDSEDRLSLAASATGEPVPGGALLEGLGPFRGPEVAVRKKDPEFRTGLERTDRVWETFYPLPRRLLVDSAGGGYTISRGRTGGLPLVGRPSGRDQVVRVTRTRSGLRLDRPFEGVEAFILDFALLRRMNQPPAIVLLVNEKEDGTGRAWLLMQEAAPGVP